MMSFVIMLEISRGILLWIYSQRREIIFDNFLTVNFSALNVFYRIKPTGEF